MNNGSELTTAQRNELIEELSYHNKRIYEIGELLGFDNIQEKAKLKLHLLLNGHIFYLEM